MFEHFHEICAIQIALLLFVIIDISSKIITYLCLEEGGVGFCLNSFIVLNPCSRNDVLSFQLNDFIMNSALLLEVQNTSKDGD